MAIWYARSRFVAIVMVVVGIARLQSAVCPAQENENLEYKAHKAEAETYFRDRVAPFIRTYCISCHSNRRPTEAGVNFSPAIKRPGHAAFSQQWIKSAARVAAHDMPPEYADKQPSEEERQMFESWMAKLKYLSPQDPGLFVIRRLTKREYGNTLRDLFGVAPAIADDLPEDVGGEGYLNSLSPLQLEQYLAIAQRVLDQVLAPEGEPPTKIQQQLLGETPAPDADALVAARRVAQSIARRAYRRPPTEAELDVLIKVFELGRQNDLDYVAAVRLMLKAMLVSPQFLFITPSKEVDPKTEIVPLDDHQLASRISYLLWQTMPDDELSSLADRGELSQPDVLEAQVTRLLLDPRSRALFDGFGTHWLGLGKLRTKAFDPAMFPQMNERLRSSMYDEVRLVFESIVRENRSAVEFIESDYTFLNEDLAAIYGLDKPVVGREMRRVQLSDANRGGVLGMPGTLAATSFPNRTSPVNRGVWVLERLLGEHVPPAPPDVPALEKQDGENMASLTLRERTELHRTNVVCANCHKILDPIGFGLENFDAIGRWRDKDVNGNPIDATGELPGGKRFSKPSELKAIIAERRDEFCRNLVERLLAYALCRNLEGYDAIVVDRLMEDVARDEYRMQTLILAVVTSYPFTHRRIQVERNSK